jgi:hypothetical protein
MGNQGKRHRHTAYCMMCVCFIALHSSRNVNSESPPVCAAHAADMLLPHRTARLARATPNKYRCCCTLTLVGLEVSEWWQKDVSCHSQFSCSHSENLTSDRTHHAACLARTATPTIHRRSLTHRPVCLLCFFAAHRYNKLRSSGRVCAVC